MLDQGVLDHTRKVWREYCERLAELRQRRIDELGASLKDFLEDLLNYPLVRPWRQSLEQFHEHHWQQDGIRLTAKSYEEVAALIESAVNDPTCYAHGPIQPVDVPMPPIRPACDLAEASLFAKREPGASYRSASLMQVDDAPATAETANEDVTSAEQRGQLQRFARRVSYLEQQRIGLSDDESARYEYFVYQNVLRQIRGEPPLEQLEFWLERNDAFNRQHRLVPRPAGHEAPQKNANTGNKPTKPGADSAAVVKPKSNTRRGNQAHFAEEAEEIVSEEVGVPRNSRGPNQQTIPGSGRGGIRIPDLKVRGADGSVRWRGSVIEIKASTGSKFGDLSGPARRQILDYVTFAEQLQRKSRLAKNPRLKAWLQNAHVEVFSDLPKPTSGRFATLIEQKLLKWHPIPRPSQVGGNVARGTGAGLVSTPASPGVKPGLGPARNLALGMIVSLLEVGIADAAYRKSAAVLEDLLQQIAKNGEADEVGWQAISKKLQEIGEMKQSRVGFAWEVISYGQGSLPEQKAMAMMVLASELGEKYGYQNPRTWTEVMRGELSRFHKKP